MNDKIQKEIDELIQSYEADMNLQVHKIKDLIGGYYGIRGDIYNHIKNWFIDKYGEDNKIALTNTVYIHGYDNFIIDKVSFENSDFVFYDDFNESFCYDLEIDRIEDLIFIFEQLSKSNE